MGDTPSDWGVDSEPAYSMSTAGDNDGGAPSDYTVSASATAIAARANGDLADSITLALEGGARFAGRPGTNYLKTGAASIHGLPAGVSAKVMVVNPRRVRVALTGSTTTSARFFLTFTDSAFARGVSAAQVTGDGLSSRTPLAISVAAAERRKLQELVAEAVLVRQGNYSYASYRVFDAAVERAQAALADTTASTATLRGAAEALTGMIAALAIDEGGQRVLEGEQSDEWSGGDLKNEANSGSGNLGGVRDGSWIQYKNLVFDVAPTTLAIRYASKYSPDGTPSSLEVRAGTQDGPIVGEAALPGTGSWGDWVTIQVEITDPAALVQARDVTFVFHAPDGQDWVSNFDWFQFGPQPDDPGDGPVDTTALEAAIAEAEKYVDSEDRYGSIDFGVLRRELDQARAVFGSGTVTQAEVDAQARALRLAYEQLVPRARLALENTVEQADSLDEDRYTKKTWAALTRALERAKVSLADAAASDARLTKAEAALARALAGLKAKPA